MTLVRFVFLLFLLLPIAAQAEQDYSHYAFANYLGSGLYRTDGQNATVVNIPLEHQISQSEKSSWSFHSPISLGFFNFTWTELPEGDIPDGVGTVTVIPGLKYTYHTSKQHQLETYGDLGYGHNFTTGDSVVIYSTGISSILHFDYGQTHPVWVNRLFLAGYAGIGENFHENYTSLQSGIDIGTNIHWNLDNVSIEPRLFSAVYWHFDKLEFKAPIDDTEEEALSYELGLTFAFSKPIGWDFIKINRIGFSYREGENLQVWRLIFNFPI